MSGHVHSGTQIGTHTVEVVYVGSAGHLRRFKVLDAAGKYVPGGLFRTFVEAQGFIVDRERQASA